MWLPVWCRVLLSRKACLQSLDGHTRLIVIWLLTAWPNSLHVSGRHSLHCLCLVLITTTNSNMCFMTQLKYLSLWKDVPWLPHWKWIFFLTPSPRSLLLMSFSVTSSLTCCSMCSWWYLRPNTSCQNHVIMLRCCLFGPIPFWLDLGQFLTHYICLKNTWWVGWWTNGRHQM